MKGQMFIITVIFLAVFVFVVQQLLFQYSTLDTTKPFGSDEALLLRSVTDSLNATIATTVVETPECREAEDNVKELRAYFERQIVRGGFTVDIDYVLDCFSWENLPPDPPALTASVRIVGTERSASGAFGFYHGPVEEPPPPPPPPPRPAVCGNGRIEGTEQCDGSNLGGNTCQSLGYTGGTLRCFGICQLSDPTCRPCTFDPSGCF